MEIITAQDLPVRVLTGQNIYSRFKIIIITNLSYLISLKVVSNMNSGYKDLSTALINNYIRPSFQRIKVLEYLIKNQFHPTVDQIFKDLQNEIPTLSKTTIYNTLDLFVAAGLVRVLTIEDNETRYDIVTENHGHFKCEECGGIYNFKVDLDLLTTDELTGFKVLDRNVYFKGVCSKCLLNMNNNKRKE
ncbi:MAG: Fur family transcriptional regulator [Dethiobacteria bacterium]|nr:Fur family transcriptional regulator [Dethiobacteria bacterium]